MSFESTTPKYSATDKERFDQCISMLKAYYDALEARLGATVGFFVLIVGWIITSASARHALSDQRSLRLLAIVTLILMTIAFSLNVKRWVRRWSEIRRSLDALGYIEPRFYARYDLPKRASLFYIAPVALLCLVIIVCVILLGYRKV